MSRALPVPASTFAGRVVLLCGEGGPLTEGLAQAFRAAGGVVARDGEHGSDDDRDPPLAIEALFDAAEHAHGPADILVIDCATPRRHAAEELGWREWRAIQARSVDLAFLAGGAFARRRLSAGQGGDILVVTANHAVGGCAGNCAQAAAAAAIASLVQSWTVEWLSDDIRANLLEIGFADGLPHPALDLAAEYGGRAEDSVPLPRLGRIDDVAAMALFLASPYAAYIAGASVRVDGGEWLRASLGGPTFSPPRVWAKGRMPTRRNEIA